MILKLNPGHLKSIAVVTTVICAGTVALGFAMSVYRHRTAESRSSYGNPTSAPPTIPQLLQEINSRQNPQTNEFMNAERAQLIREKLDGGHLSPDKALRGEFEYGKELLNAGKTDEAVRAFQKAEQLFPVTSPALRQRAEPAILTEEAVAYLRMGEVQNCCSSNNARSCLIPISGAGIHTKQEGSRGAIACLLKVLKLQPDNVGARWLLNIAFMTVGEYPQSVPPRWKIPARTFGADYPMKKFYNAAPDLGLDFEGWAGGVILDDFEGNGLLDFVISSQSLNGQLRYIHNNGDGTFSDRTSQSGLVGEVGGLNIITTDFNNDGPSGHYCASRRMDGKERQLPSSLLRNDGNGHFTDVTIQSGLMTIGPTQTAVAFDYNGDGLLDLFVGYESVPSGVHPSKLFRNNGDGTFTDVTEQCGLHITRFVKAVVSADYMHSGRPGLYLSCMDGPNVLLRNDGPAGVDKSPNAPWKFTDVSQSAGVDKQVGTFSCFFFDYDNDGWPDLYVGGYGYRNISEIASDYLGLPTSLPKAKLYHNNHDGTFTDVSAQAHLDKVILGMGLNYGDLDNDGWLDFYAGTGTPDLGTLIPKRMFRNHDGKYFDEVTTTGDFGHLQKGHGIAFGDLNNNGQQDVFIVLGGAFEGDTAHDALFVNPGNANHWITLSLEGVKSNRIALGAEICVTVSTPAGNRKIYKTVSTGGSFGNNPLRQEIGLGNATAIKQVTIHWPATGIDQTIKDLKMDRFYKIREGDTAAIPWDVPTFALLHPTQHR